METDTSDRWADLRSNRRQFLTACAVVGIGAAGCIASQGPRRVGYIRYLGWGGNTQATVETIFDRWSDERGIDVRHVSAGGDDEMLSYLQEHPGDVTCSFRPPTE